MTAPANEHGLALNRGSFDVSSYAHNWLEIMPGTPLFETCTGFGLAVERARSRQTLQLRAFVHGQFEGWLGASGEHIAAYRDLFNIASYLWDTTLGEVTQSHRYTDLAKCSLATMRHLVERGPSSEVPMGAFTGWGGIIYVLTHLSQLSDQPGLLIEARAMIGNIERLVEQDCDFDIIGGAAGTIGSLLGL